MSYGDQKVLNYSIPSFSVLVVRPLAKVTISRRTTASIRVGNLWKNVYTAVLFINGLSDNDWWVRSHYINRTVEPITHQSDRVDEKAILGTSPQAKCVYITKKLEVIHLSLSNVCYCCYNSEKRNLDIQELFSSLPSFYCSIDLESTIWHFRDDTRIISKIETKVKVVHTILLVSLYSDAENKRNNRFELIFMNPSFLQSSANWC